MKRIGKLAAALLLTALPVLNIHAKEDVLVVVREQGPNSLDIQGIGTNRPAYGTSWNIYDRLLTYGRKELSDGTFTYDYQSLKPELAESWKLSDDGSMYLFTLRDTVFHDGSPVTAHDVKWSFDRAVTIGGFASFQMKAGSLENPEQFVVVDDKTFGINIVRKDKLTLPDIAVPVPAIYNAKLAKKHATKTDPWAQEWLKSNDAGGGAYQISRFEPGVQVVLQRFEKWKSGPLPEIERIVERVVPSSATRRAMLERGDVDISFDLPPRDFSEISKNSKLKVAGLPVENSMWYIDMNVTQAPFDKVKVRKAISYTLPYEDIFQSSTYDRAKPLYGGSITPGKAADWPAPFPFHKDIEKAKKLLKEAGYPDGFNIKLYYNLGTATWGEPIALLTQEALKKIGINVTVEKVPAANWRAEMGKKSMPFLVNNMGGWLNYPDYFFYWNYHSQNGVFNTMSFQDKEMDRHIDVARFANSEKEYEEAISSFLSRAYDQAPRIPLFQANLDVAMQPNIHGYHYWFHRQIDYRQLSKN